MATVEDFIFSRLTTDPGIAAAVGTRVYRVRMPDNPQLPAITFQTVSGSVVESFDGYSGLALPVVQVDCWARTAKAAQDLALLVRGALLGYAGIYQDLRVQKVTEWGQFDLYDADTEIFHVSCSCRVWYS
ncbi:MAG: DUF3168 domain-containing protein [Gemmataceae bacterium]|nr:DUF3168 domain-containing protein [Gemmataceae bacterium]